MCKLGKDTGDKRRFREKEITEPPCLAHFDPKKDKYIATDACKTVMRATFWQKEGKVLRLKAFASKYLSGCKKTTL